jgi:6-phosphogluconolactonase (cycloisomerase 2 family)
VRCRAGTSSTTLIVLLCAAILSSCNTQSSHLAYVTMGANGILAFRIRNSNGVITNVFTSPFLAGDSTFGIVVHPSNQFAFVADQKDGTISLLDIDLTSGSITERTRTAAGLSPGPMVLDPSGRFLWVADQVLNQILAFSVASNGSLSPVSSASVGSTPTSLTLASTGLLFAPVPSFSSIYIFSVNSGVLTQVCVGAGPVCSPLEVNDGVGSVAVDPTGKFLYVPNPPTNTVSGFTIGSGGTGIAPVPGKVFPTESSPTAAAVDPGGKYLYVANSGSSTVSEYTIDSVGDLTAFTTPTQKVGSGPEFIQFDPDGKFVYVANQGAKSIAQFVLNSNGTLNSTSNTMSVGSTPRALALTK